MQSANATRAPATRRFSVEAERAYYGRPSSEYAPLPSLVVDQFMALTTGTPEWPELLDGKDVLELGAGGCALLARIVECSRPRRYVASDLFPDRMRAAAEHLGDPCLQFRELDLLKTGLADGSFDVVLCFGLLHHIPDIGDAFRECRRILRPGGRLIFRDPWAGNPLLWFLHRFVYEASANERPLRLRPTSALVRSSGFRVEHVSRFWLRFPWAPPGPWSTNLAMVAVKEGK